MDTIGYSNQHAIPVPATQTFEFFVWLRWLRSRSRKTLTPRNAARGHLTTRVHAPLSRARRSFALVMG